MKQTNLQRAKEIVKQSIENRISKQEVLVQLVNELSISRSNAFVYYTKASKEVGGVVGSIKQRAIGETRKIKKVKQIDDMIDQLKAKGPTSPFAMVGV